MRIRYLFLCLLLGISISAISQEYTSTVDKIAGFPGKVFNKVNAKAAGIEKKLERKTEKYLERLAKNERKLQRKLSRIDSAAAQTLFSTNTASQYEALSQQISSDSFSATTTISGDYQPYIDTIQNSLLFLTKNAELVTSSKILPENIQRSLQQVTQLQEKLQEANQVKQIIFQRREQLKRYLDQYQHLPPSVTRLYKDYYKQAWYYNQQLQEYKAMLNDPGKMMQAALKLLNKLPAFTQFIQKHSMLAGLFNIPGNTTAVNGTAQQGILALQSRNQVMATLQNQVGPNMSALARQNLQSAQGQLEEIRSKLGDYLSSGELDMPNLPAGQAGFRPNDQKTKTFLQRLEYGTNLQTTSANHFFPTTTDIGLSVGYKLSSKNVIGIGASYKVGWGKDIRHINVSSQGAGIRSYIDINVKKSFFMSGGFEYNYQQPGLANSPSTGGGQGEAWQKSGLLGISKIVSMKTKLFKKTKIQLLWDFLSYEQVPRTPAVKFRIGYNF